MTEEMLLDNDPAATRKRSTFLSAICILMWIGCTIVIGINLLIYKELSGHESYYPEEQNRINILAWSALIFVFMALLTAAGTILMWLRRRAGFYLYLFAQLVSLVLLGYLLLLDGALRYARAVDLLIFSAAFALPLCFIVLFALQLKHMRKPLDR